MPLSQSPNTFIVDLEPLGKRVQLDPDKNIVDAALLAGLDLVTSCNGLGICGSCKIRLINGELSEVTDEERNQLSALEIQEGIRLACQTSPNSDVKIFVPPSSLTQGQQLQLEGKHFKIQLAPIVSALDIDFGSDLINQLFDLSILFRKTSKEAGHEITRIAKPLSNSILKKIKDYKGAVRLIIRNNEIINVLPKGSPYYGLALDIGSTKIAVFWVDLSNAAVIEQNGIMNPQIPFGEDVVNRISYANRGESERYRLQNVLIDTINLHILETSQTLHINRDQIVDMVVVGNTVIHHLFCGFPVKSLGESPYLPFKKQALELPASEIGIQIADCANIYFPPIIAGYVGADHTAAILATRMAATSQTVCLIDVGTNTEISLIHHQIIRSCSCASGPAFEGAHIQDGMRAASGAIEKVRIDNDQISFQTINQKPPVGICGSGILSIAAEFHRNQIVDRRGVFQSSHHLTHQQNGQKYVVIAKKTEGDDSFGIRVTRKDINEIQLAKGAIRSGIEILCLKTGIKPKDIDQFLIAGAFGTHLHLESAIEIGMFPDVDINRYHQIGNAAGVGARELLVNAALRNEAQDLVANIQYIELTTEPEFSNIYIQALYLERNAIII